MKHILNFTAVALICLVAGGGCDLKQYATPANVRSASALLCSNTINYAVSAADRIEVANYVYSVAHAVRSLSGGKVPTPKELEAAIKAFTPNGSRWVTLASNIAGVWGAIYPQVQGDPAKALAFLEAIAAGCEDAAASFIPPAPR